MIKKLKKVLAIILTTSICFTTTDLTAIAADSTTQSSVIEDDILSLSSTYKTDSYSIDFSFYEKWEDGYNACIKITNTGDFTIENWHVTFDFENEIDNIWNATIKSHTNNKYIIKNTKANQDILAGETVEFGIQVKEKFTDYPRNCKLIGTKTVENKKNYSVEYNLESDWNSGFVGSILITNNTDHVLEDWIVEFDFNRAIDYIWNGVIQEKNCNHYVIKNAGYNANIEPNETIKFGFTGTEGEKTEVPTNINLYSYSIEETGDEWVTLEDGKIDKNYLYDMIYPALLLKGLSIDNVRLSDDYDKDGLSLSEEFNYDTNPFLSDTDDDGLSDYEEVYFYSTSPILWDTDNDGMGDGTEVNSGLNPLEKDSNGNGISDNKEIVTQKLTFYDNNFKGFDSYPQIDITGQGDYSKRIKAVSLEYDKTLTDIDAVVGTPFEFEHDDKLSFDDSTLTFYVNNEILKNNKIEDLVIGYYDDDTNFLELLESTYDKDNKSISAKVSHYSKYMLVNADDYIYNYDIDNKESIITSGKADVVFVVDTTGSMKSAVTNVKNNINTFVKSLQENKVDVRLGLIEYRDIYADGAGSTKSYNWYTDVNSFKNTIGTLGTSGGGDIPESVVDALYCAQKMTYRHGVNKYIILISDANYKNGVVGNSSVTMNDAINDLKNNNFVVSTITDTTYYSDYSNLVNETDGILANIYNNFAIALEPLIIKMGVQVNKGCWIRLSNGQIVCVDKDPRLEDITIDTDKDGIPDVEELSLCTTKRIYNRKIKDYVMVEVWSFLSDPTKADTDGDGILDIDDIEPTIFDIRPTTITTSVIRFNTDREWWIDTKYTSKDIWDAYRNLQNAKNDPFNYNESKYQQILIEAAEYVNHNDLQTFVTDELFIISLLDPDGITFYLDSKPVSERETLFKKVYGRDTDYYQRHRTGLFSKEWKKVSGYEAGKGWFKGKVLSEADMVYSFETYRIFDINTIIDLALGIGITILVTIAVVYTTEAAIATVEYALYNIKALSSYVSNYGIKMGFDYYLALGPSYAPSFMGALTQELADGDDDEVSLINYADDVLHMKQNPWVEDQFIRGNLIDEAAGNNLGHNFPVADNLDKKTGVLTSVKSMDIKNASSYKTGAGIYNKIVRDARTLYNFQGKRWGGKYVSQGVNFDSKALRIVLQDISVSREQMMGITAAKQYIATEYNIQLIITVTIGMH